DELENPPRRRRDPAVILERQRDAFLGRIGQRLLDTLDRPRGRLVLGRVPGYAAREDADHGASSSAARSMHNRVLASCSSRLGPGGRQKLLPIAVPEMSRPSTKACCL